MSCVAVLPAVVATDELLYLVLRGLGECDVLAFSMVSTTLSEQVFGPAVNGRKCPSLGHRLVIERLGTSAAAVAGSAAIRLLAEDGPEAEMVRVAAMLASEQTAHGEGAGDAKPLLEALCKVELTRKSGRTNAGAGGAFAVGVLSALLAGEVGDRVALAAGGAIRAAERELDALVEGGNGIAGYESIASLRSGAELLCGFLVHGPMRPGTAELDAAMTALDETIVSHVQEGCVFLCPGLQGTYFNPGAALPRSHWWAFLGLAAAQGWSTRPRSWSERSWAEYEQA